MPEAVEANAPEPGAIELAAEAAGEIGRVDRWPSRCGEDEAAVAPVRPCGLTLLVLLLLMLLEGVDAFGGDRTTALGRPGLGGKVGEAARAGALERAPDAGRSGGEVEVFPAEAEEFALAEAGA